MRSVVQVYLGPPGWHCAESTYIGAVAQLGERRLCKAEAVGSIPISSIAQDIITTPSSQASADPDAEVERPGEEKLFDITI